MNRKVKKIFEAFAVIIFFSAFTFSLLKPIEDSDVFWHLKTGEWIWQNRSLPDNDPFSFAVKPFQNEETVRTSVILKQYWLAQLLMYGFYQAGGFYGVIAFRCFIYLGIVLLLYYRTGKKVTSRAGILIILLPAVLFSGWWLGERPNNLSFLFAVIVVYLLEKLRTGNEQRAMSNEHGTGGVEHRAEGPELRKSDYYLLPLVMLLWANMHGGFILGDVIIVIYVVAELLKLVSAGIRKEKKSAPTAFLSVCVISILMSLINPNTYLVIPMLFEYASVKYSVISVVEHSNIIRNVTMGDFKYIIFVCAVTVPVFLRPKKLGLSPALLLLFLIVFTIYGMRYIPFTVFVATLFIGNVWGDFLDKHLKKAERFYMPAVIAIFITAYLFLVNIEDVVVLKNRAVISSYYPEKAVKFIKKERPGGELFNDYALGGYLIWSLYPDYKVFIDGRRLSTSAEWSYVSVLSGSAMNINGTPEWKTKLDRFGINLILVSGIDIDSGGFVRLVRRLVEDKEWSLVLVDKETLVFMRNTETNKEIARRYSLSKMLAYDLALRQAEIFRLQFPKYWKSYTTLGEINLYMGRPQIALTYFESAMALNPLLVDILGGLVDDLKANRDYQTSLERALLFFM